MSRAVLLIHAEEERQKKRLRITRRTLRDRSNPLFLPDNEFVRQFRLSKVAFEELFREIVPHLSRQSRSTGIRDELKVSIKYISTVAVRNLTL